MAMESGKAIETRDRRIPGFNAGASLYVSPATYRSRRVSGGRSGSLQPALDNFPRRQCYCIKYNGEIICDCQTPNGPHMIM